MSKTGLFSDDWLDIQRKYWDSWTDLSRKALGVEGGAATKPWESALDHWWKAMSPAAPDAAKGFMERMMEQGKVFFRMAETFVPGGSGAPTVDGWSALNKTLEDLKSQFRGNLDESGDALHRMMAFWEMPLDNWQRMTSFLSPVPGDFLRNAPDNMVRGQMDRVLSAPGLGYTREEQTQYQDLTRRSLDYQNALQEYLGFYSHLGVKSVERMRSYLQGVVDGGQTIDSARAIYDAWVGCCEDVYAEEVMTPEYARVHGQLINAQMALKHRMAIMVDKYLGAMNMPTRSEVRTLQDRLQETRRENKRLSQELAELQREVAALGKSRSAGATVAAANQPAATKEPVIRKKAPAKPAGN